MRVPRSHDFWSGLLFASLGLAALTFSVDLRVDTAARMGPGFVPRVLGFTLVGLGVLLAARGALRERDVVAQLRLRPLVYITLAVVAFALLLPRLGLVAAVAAVVLIGAASNQDITPSQAVGVTLVMTVLSVCIFKLALGMTFDAIVGVW